MPACVCRGRPRPCTPAPWLFPGCAALGPDTPQVGVLAQVFIHPSIAAGKAACNARAATVGGPHRCGQMSSRQCTPPSSPRNSTNWRPSRCTDVGLPGCTASDSAAEGDRGGRRGEASKETGARRTWQGASHRQSQRTTCFCAARTTALPHRALSLHLPKGPLLPALTCAVPHVLQVGAAGQQLALAARVARRAWLPLPWLELLQGRRPERGGIASGQARVCACVCVCVQRMQGGPGVAPVSRRLSAGRLSAGWA